MKHMVRIDDVQVEKLHKIHPEWGGLDYQDLVDLAIASITEVKKK